MQLKSPIYLVYATKTEGAPVKRVIFDLPSPSRGEGGGEGDHEIKLVQIGVGTKNLPKFFAQIRETKPPPSLICSFGLSGGLIDSLKVGDLVLPDRFVTSDGPPLTLPSPARGEGKKDFPSPFQPKADPSSGGEGEGKGEGDLRILACSVIRKLGYHFVEGTLLTSSVVLATEAQKREAGLKYGAIAVDMETYPLAQFCSQENISFLSVRAIFDPLSWDLTGLSHLKILDETGNFRPIYTAGSFLKNPKMIFHLPRYQKALSLGCKKIASFFSILLDKISKY